MKSLSSLERIILECIGSKQLSYQEVQSQTGLYENVCFNLLQSLILQGLLQTQNGLYQACENIPSEFMNEINCTISKNMESIEMIEATIEHREDSTFRFKKIALDERDEKIFLAMLSNIDSFLQDAHKKSEKYIPIKNRKVIFWGMGEVHNLMNHMILGK